VPGYDKFNEFSAVLGVEMISRFSRTTLFMSVSDVEVAVETVVFDIDLGLSKLKDSSVIVPIDKDLEGLIKDST